MKTILFAAASLLAPGLAQAQTASERAPTAQLSEIVVTAQRREERLTDVPIAITAVSGATLEKAGVNAGLQLGLITPGLNFAVQGAFAQPTIRGIGTSLTGSGADANVAIYVDGVYQPNQSGNLMEFNNVERIEVLKGPQGTLFGRNATGGAIRIITRDPAFSPEAEVNLSYGRFNDRKASFYGTAPLTDTVAVNIAGLLRKDDGYIDNVFLHNKTGHAVVAAVRSKLLVQPTDRLKFVLAGNYSNSNDNSPFAVNPLNGNSVYVQQGAVIPRGTYVTSLSFDPDIKVKSRGLSLTASYKTDLGTFTSITSYQELRPFLWSDIDNTSLFANHLTLLNVENTFTQEVTYASAYDGPLNWIGGVFLYRDKTKLDLQIFSGAAPPPFRVVAIEGYIKTDAAAAFAEVNYDVTDRLHLIGGLRYSDEEKQALGGTPVATVVNTKAKWHALTPRFSARYALDPATNVYATYSRGFKSGNYNLSGLSSTPVNPEKVDAYELGLKHSAGPLRINTSAYYYDYKDIQVQIQTNAGGVARSVLQNAATAKIYGLDFDGAYTFDENWSAMAGAAYTHARYNSYKNALITTPIFINGLPAGNSQVAGDASGNKMIRTPEFTANLTLNYRQELAEGEFEASSTVAYSSGFYWDPGNKLKEPAYTVVNGRLAWTEPKKRYRVSVWGNNLTNKKYLFYANNTTTGDLGVYAKPTTYGVALDLYFK